VSWLVVHLIAVWGWLLGRPGSACASCGHPRKAHSASGCAGDPVDFERECACAGYVSPNPEAEAKRAADYASAHFSGLLAALAKGHNRVLLVEEPRGSWRRELAPEHSEASVQWPREAWAPLDRMVRESGHEVVRAERYPAEAGAGPSVDIGGGLAINLGGSYPSGRDVISTLALQYLISVGARAKANGGDWSLTIASGRTSLSSLVCDAASISLLREPKLTGEEWSWKIEREAEVRARLGYDHRLCADVEALASLDGIGAETARALVAGGKLRRREVPGYGSALVAVQMAAQVTLGDKLPGLDERQMQALRTASADSGAGVLRALAIHGLRSDAPGVARVLEGARGDGVDREAERGGSGGLGLPRGHQGVRRARRVGVDDVDNAPEQSVALRDAGGGQEGGSRKLPEPTRPAGDAPRAEEGVVHASPRPDAEPSGQGAGSAETADASGLRGGGAAVRATAPTEPPRAAPVAERRLRDAPSAANQAAAAREKVSVVREERGESMSQQETTVETKAEIVNPQAPASMVVHREQRALVAPGDFGPEHMRIVREAFAPSASQAEFEVMWAGAKARRLDPVRKQIHFVKRKQKVDGQWVERWTSIVAIDGFRAIAEGTGLYDGQDEPEYEYDEENRLVLARVRVWRKDISRPFVGVARWNEYVQTTQDGSPTQTWQKMEHTMLSKCAEALAHRKAFPEPLAGLYTGDEMAQADNERGPRETRQAAPGPRPSRLAMRVAELAASEDIDAARKVLTAEMAARSVPFDVQQKALADFDARAGRPAA
jgi:phage recombination protein Bet